MVLKKEREARGLSQVAVAKAGGLTQPEISKWENGERHPALEDLPKLDRGLGAPTGYLLTAAGYVTAATSVPEAVAMDPLLSPASREVLLDLYGVRLERDKGGSLGQNGTKGGK